MSHMHLPTLAEVGLAIYISAPANTITIQIPKTHRNICKTKGCNQKKITKGLCRKHGGSRTCTVAGCFTRNKGGGLCQAHGGGKRCSTEGCNKGVQSYGRCRQHGGTRFCSVTDCRCTSQKLGFCMRHHYDAYEHSETNAKI